MRSDEERDPVGEWVRLAGKTTDAPDNARKAVRSAVYHEWHRSVTRRIWKRRTYLVILTAAIAGLASLASFHWLPEPVPNAPIGLVENVSGEVTVEGTEAQLMIPRMYVLQNSRIVSGETGRLLLRLAGGGAVRLDRESALTIGSASRITLQEGVAYFDSGRHSADFIITTPFGVITNNGTQFEVLVRNEHMRIRVREGSVKIQRKTSRTSAAAGTEMVLDSSGIASISKIPMYGTTWNWISEVAPTFNVEGRPLIDLLRWLSRENGWILQFAEQKIFEDATSTILHGSIADLHPDQIPAVVLPVCGLAYELKDGVLRIHRMDEE